ncbi:Cyclin-D4-1 [Acorus calamus]|uniref:Cyclin-D4-1 n=1 Tax=Acorus calamus TaxID=4465 RepID=A0AAV9ETP0_ACOCL|nr:Cyclin-D4-1 [Acorus calamus]
MSLSPESLTASSLYCAEDADEVASWDTESSIFDGVGDDEINDDRSISGLFSSEVDHMPSPDYLSRLRCLNSTSRQDAITWMLKVHSLYRFRPVTAYLSVNYLDRFLSLNTLPVRRPVMRGATEPDQETRWPYQLLAVACVSLAAKMEETHVPLMLDLQLFEPRFVFDPKTVRRMELLVMSSLQWRLRSVTPFDFVPLFADRRRLEHVFLARVSGLINKTLRVVDFVGFRPSIVAAAAVTCAAGEPGESASLHALVSEDSVRDCRRLMEEYLVDTCPSAWLKPEAESAPRSPVGVLDAAACGSCDSGSSVSDDASRSGVAAAAPGKRRKLCESGRFAGTTNDSTGDDP